MAKGIPNKKLGFVNDAGEFELSPVTPEELEQAEKDAKKARVLVADYHSMSPAEIAAHNASYFEEQHRKAHKRKVTKSSLRELAVNLRTQGRHTEAFALLPNDEKFKAGAEAIDRPNDEFCDCVPDKFKNLAGIELTKPLYSYTPVMVGDTPSTLWRCLKCGHLNVTPQIPPQMQRYMEHKAAARRNPALAHEVFLLG